MSPNAPAFDLQSHSLHSDGELAPAGVVAAAAASGVKLLSVTDHDSVAGVAEARAAGSQHGITVVPGVEISVLDEPAEDLHLLGYLIDTDNEPLAAQLESSRLERKHRATRIVQRLRELGWAVDTDYLAKLVRGGKPVGRPHLAQAVVDHPDNQDRLDSEGVNEPSAFLVAYLIEGTPGFLPRSAPSMADAIELIHGAGGLAVWAHPFWDIDAGDAVLAALERFHGYGLDGVEAFYVTHNREQTELLVRKAAELGLLTTGSADFHGHAHSRFNRFRAFETFSMTPNLGPIAQSTIG
ncbi:MAG: PHP domain-containing protein [Solirubrobacterales bacterium]|nr:PHP domain-containing protein [Solirubrobacterales bacterium]